MDASSILAAVIAACALLGLGFVVVSLRRLRHRNSLARRARGDRSLEPSACARRCSHPQHADRLQIRLGRVDADAARVLFFATKAWAECLTIGEKNGWRNSQASVLAPTGCLTADSLITTDRGLVRLGELGDLYGDKWQDVDFHVSTDEGPQQATKFFVNGEEPTRRIVTEGGYRIQGTLAHRVKVVDESSGEWVWKRLADVQSGDLMPVQLGTMIGEPRRVPLPVLDQAYYAGDRDVVVPDSVDVELAELVGYFMGDGSLHAKGIRFCVADTDLDVVERLKVLGKSLFNQRPVSSRDTSRSSSSRCASPGGGRRPASQRPCRTQITWARDGRRAFRRPSSRRMTRRSTRASFAGCSRRTRQ